MDDATQALERWCPRVFEDRTQQLARLAPFVALQTEQDRRLVRKVLVQRADAHARLLRDSGHGEARRPLLRQNLNSGLQDRPNQLVRACLLRLFSRVNLILSAGWHR